MTLRNTCIIISFVYVAFPVCLRLSCIQAAEARAGVCGMGYLILSNPVQAFHCCTDRHPFSMHTISNMSYYMTRSFCNQVFLLHANGCSVHATVCMSMQHIALQGHAWRLTEHSTVILFASCIETMAQTTMHAEAIVCKVHPGEHLLPAKTVH